jgi:type I restriction enzyme M protein
MSKKKALGQFFTPKFIVEFIYDMILKMRPKGVLIHSRIIDPACGEGIFLKYAIENNITRPELVFGIDKDEEISKVWDELGLSKIIGKNLYIQDGLYDTPDCRVFIQYENRKFDIVVGNPPYGGIGIKNLEKDEKLYNALKKYELWKNNFRNNQKNQEGLFSDEYISNIKRLSKEEIRRIERFPIEVLFLERFIQLAKTNGIIGIIIPEGILANSNMQYIRDWIMSKCDIEAIISLPRSTFKDSGTTAKTAILFLRKLKENEVVHNDKYIFMASMEDDSKENFNKREEMKNIVNAYENSEVSIKLNPTKIIKDVKWGDIIGSRADPDYWLPEYRKLEDKMIEHWEVKNLGEFIESITYGQVGERIYSNKGIRYITTSNFDTLFLDLNLKKRFLKPGSHNDPKRSRVKKGDLLLVGNGVACIGRSSVYMFDEEANIEQNIVLIKTKNISNYFLDLFIKSKYGQLQINRLLSSVGTAYINFPNIKKIKIPCIDKSIQKNIESEYKNIHEFYLRVLEKNDDKNKVIIKVSDIVNRLEELIEGKRDEL